MKKYVVLSFLILTACGLKLEGPGFKIGSEDKNETQSLSYELEENGCNTGKHEFSSRESYCTGLRNNTLNNGCAYSLRKDRYRAECSGDFITFDL